MKRCVIIGGAPISDYSFIRNYLSENDFFIFCDSGLKHTNGLGTEPDLVVGDFDSYQKPCITAETITLPCEKDDTDTVFAVKEALSRGFDDYLIIGAVGKRLDHTLANVYILSMLDNLGKKAKIVDDFSEMELVSRSPVLIEDSFPFFSLLNINGTAEDITVENAKYPLSNAKIESDYQYGISNEVLKGKTARVTVGKGSLLLVKIIKE